MKRILSTFLFFLFPVLCFAAESTGTGDSLSFSPPPSDFSVVFLGNIFGIVDGVLHGTGSQIMGTMFGVFNSAVLALGGIIIMYTLLVSTMNTAHEGQMLGQKWSSIWVPMRSTLGLALLIPKASGYCLMQIFVMWVTVQGVGAADKVWNAALSYLNRGGTIVQSQVNPLKEQLNGSTATLSQGAAVILSGQVCMAGIQQILESQRQNLIQLQSNKTGKCYGTNGTDVDKDMKPFCDTPVPDFIGSVNVISVQQKTASELNKPGEHKTQKYTAQMPNFSSSSPYAALNGICGTLTWNSLDGQLGEVGNYTKSLSQQNYDAAKLTRVMALQQMYEDLATLARIMIKNNPQLNTLNSLVKPDSVFSVVAQLQFGIPTEANGTVCEKSNSQCNSWNPVTTNNTTQIATLFNGTEFQGAISDYNAIMGPTLTYIAQANNKKQASKQREFIQKAETEGWAMAGSYFFDLARLSSSNEESSNLIDSKSGLATSFTVDNITKYFTTSTPAANLTSPPCKTGTYKVFCTWMNDKSTLPTELVNFINGDGLGDAIQFNNVVPTKMNPSADKPFSDLRSSTVYGFIRNSLIIQLPGQPGSVAPSFRANFDLNMDNSAFWFPPKQFGCKGFLCLASIFADIFYNLIFVGIWNIIMNFISGMLNTLVFMFILGPLEGMAEIFLHGVTYLQHTNANPIVSLAAMGVNYINFAGNLWMYLLQLAIMSALVPILGFVLYAMLALVMPLLLSWLTIMVSIGFITAYYIPVMPYMIFTFGVIAWLISVIEAMVAAPIVAVGVTHPEGHEAFGKGEHAIMILMNVFLRPAMMIIGYISAIALSYVAVWVINSGFNNAIDFIQGSLNSDNWKNTQGSDMNPWQGVWNSGSSASQISKMTDLSGNGYQGWAGVYGFFFVILMYTTLYLTVVQKSFTLITYLPDKILRWIGGQAEGIGQETAQWGEEAKGKIEKGGEATSRASGQVQQQLTGHGSAAFNKIKPKEKTDVNLN